MSSITPHIHEALLKGRRNLDGQLQKVSRGHAPFAASAGVRTCKPADFRGKTAVVIGAGVGGLCTAYELLTQVNTECDGTDKLNVVILEARSKVGGRCVSLRNNDVLIEDDSETKEYTSENAKLENSKFLYCNDRRPKQIVKFHEETKKNPDGSERSKPYLNAGPGRIPSTHIELLKYLHKFDVPVETYIMDTSSNQTYTRPHESTVTNRKYTHNTRGLFSEILFKQAYNIIHENTGKGQGCQCGGNQPTGENCSDDVKLLIGNLKGLLMKFGSLDQDGDYNIKDNPNGEDSGNTRAGYKTLPGVDSGILDTSFSLEQLLDAEFWGTLDSQGNGTKTNFYQPQDILWQPSLLQPVGGMDQIPQAFHTQVISANGGEDCVKLNSPVKSITFDDSKDQFVITYGELNPDTYQEVEGVSHVIYADYVFCNMAMPFLDEKLDKNLLNRFDKGFQDGLNAVFKTQLSNNPTKRFLAPTTKVGWQAERKYWQEPSKNRVVPIFGGISRVDHNINQMWFPSMDIHHEYGVLTGCYNYGQDAIDMGNKQEVRDRLELASQGAQLLDEDLGKNLHNGVAIAWQNIPYIKGGWTQWHAVEGLDDDIAQAMVDEELSGELSAEGEDTLVDKVSGKLDDLAKKRVDYFNDISKGTSVDGKRRPRFFIIGDQISSLPGWQEGAVTAANKAVKRMLGMKVIFKCKRIPDTRHTVEGSI